MATTGNPHTDLVPHATYRLAYNADREYLRGALCVFIEYVQRPGWGAIHWARVSLVKDGRIYYVKPGLIIPS